MLCRFVVLAFGMDHFSLSAHNVFSMACVHEWALAIHYLDVAPHDLRPLFVLTLVVSFFVETQFRSDAISLFCVHLVFRSSILLSKTLDLSPFVSSKIA